LADEYTTGTHRTVSASQRRANRRHDTRRYRGAGRADRACQPMIDRRAAAGLCAVMAGGLILGGALALAHVPAGAAAPGEDAAPCQLSSRRNVNAAKLDVNAEAVITVMVRADCVATTRPLHVVLTVDASAGMKDDLGPLQDALAAALGRLDLPTHPYAAFGVVSFSDHAEVQRGLSSSPEQIVAGLRNIQLDTQPANPEGLQDALREGLRMLPAARPGRSAEDVRTGAREVILVASGGVDPAACDRVRTLANDVQSHGVLVMTACVGGNCDRQCLAEAASGQRFAFRAWSWGYLDDLLSGLVTASGPNFGPVARVTVLDELHENLMYLGGGDPTRGVGNRLQWNFEPWTDVAVTRSIRARAIGEGRYRLSKVVTATLHYNDVFWPGLKQTIDLDNPVIEVSQPEVVTPTAPATATHVTPVTPTATATLTPSVATPSTTPTPVPRFSQVYLPYAAQGACAFDPEASDVALLVDVSGSMAEGATGYAGTRRDAAQVAAESLLETMAAGDQVAVLQFGGHTDVLAPLAPCCAPARAGLASLGKLAGTRLELAIDAAASELGGPAGRIGVRHALVLFTDGDVLNQTDAPELDRALAAAHARGIVTYVIDVGPGGYDDVLSLIAGDAGRVVHTAAAGLVAARWVNGPALACHRP
jgi:hypothetical protein